MLSGWHNGKNIPFFFKKNNFAILIYRLMIKFSEALGIVLESVQSTGIEWINYSDSVGRVLAENVYSDINMPPFNKSAMDGYACRRADLNKELTVIETIAAGDVPRKAIEPSQCSKIMTGAMVPEGADCVIMKEYIEEGAGNTIRFIGKKTKDNICLKAEDVMTGDIVLNK